MPNPSSLSPWNHRKARTWLAGLADQSGLLRSFDDLLGFGGVGDRHQNRGIATLLILLGRRGIWPIDPSPTLAKTADRLAIPCDEPRERSNKPLTIQEHHAIGKAKESIEQEIEILRRRAGQSNMLKPIGAPGGWKPFWSGNSDEAPWHVPAIKGWLAEFQPWHNYTHHIKQMLERKPAQFPYEMRAAAGLAIMLARESLWPTNDLDDVIYLSSTKLTHVRNMIFSMSSQNKQLLSDERFRILVKSMDEENKILSARMSRVKSDAPEAPPCSWAGFWA